MKNELDRIIKKSGYDKVWNMIEYYKSKSFVIFAEKYKHEIMKGEKFGLPETLKMLIKETDLLKQRIEDYSAKIGKEAAEAIKQRHLNFYFPGENRKTTVWLAHFYNLILMEGFWETQYQFSFCDQDNFKSIFYCSKLEIDFAAAYLGQTEEKLVRDYHGVFFSSISNRLYN